MKKIFSFLAVVLLTLGFAACEDVPAPYGIHDDIVGDGSKTLPFVQSFESSLGGYKSYTLSGEGRWINDHKAAVASGYNNADQTTTAGSYILVSPEFTLEGKENAHILMEYTLRYLKTQDNQKVMITKAFDENKPGEGWEQIPATLEEVMSWEETKTLDINVPAEYMGAKVRIALYYNTPSTKGSSWQVKNLSVLEGVAEGGEDKPEEGGVKELPYGETFESSFGAFKNYTTSGGGEWKIDFKTAKASGFDFDSKTNTAGAYYLVSPEISLKDQKEVHFSYEYILAYMSRFANGDKLFITDKFDEANAAQNWTEVPVKYVEASRTPDGKVDFKSFKKMDVQVPAEFLGKTIRVAFYHECDDKGSTTMEVKNFKIETGKAENTDTPDVKPDGDAIFSAALTSDNGGFTNFLGTSEWKWDIDTKFGCAKASGHVGGKEGHKVAGSAYFVSPEISLENVKEAHVAYAYAIGYMSQPEFHKVMVNANFSEANPEQGWVALDATHKFEDMKFAWFNNDIQLPVEYMGKKIRIAFYYECTAEKASTWEIKDFKVVAGKASEGGNEGGEEGGDSNIGDLKAPNGDFEAWVDGKPNNWSSKAGNATLTQSTDAHSGKYSVNVAGYSGANKRIAYKEIELKAGQYTMKFFAKAATSEGGSLRPGYAKIEAEMSGNSYIYGDYTNNLNDQWVEVTHEFTIDADGVYSPVIMNGKKPGKNILIDDFTLTDANGNVIIK